MSHYEVWLTTRRTPYVVEAGDKRQAGELVLDAHGMCDSCGAPAKIVLILERVLPLGFKQRVINKLKGIKWN